MERAIIFIDGNNFYHGMKKINRTSGADLDYEAFSRKLAHKREWLETRYYIGQVEQEGDLTRYQTQRKFLSYLKKYEKVSCHLGRIESRPPSGAARKLSNWIAALDKRADVDIPGAVVEELRKIAGANTPQYVEKAVDVMIAVDMVAMAHADAYDVAYLITTDGDFTPAVKEVRATGRKVFVASPVKGYQISQAANTYIPLTPEFFHGCWR